MSNIRILMLLVLGSPDQQYITVFVFNSTKFSLSNLNRSAAVFSRKTAPQFTWRDPNRLQPQLTTSWWSQYQLRLRMETSQWFYGNIVLTVYCFLSYPQYVLFCCSSCLMARWRGHNWRVLQSTTKLQVTTQTLQRENGQKSHMDTIDNIC